MSLDCICPAAQGCPGRICGVNHPQCFALQGMAPATPEIVATPTPCFATWSDGEIPPLPEVEKWQASEPAGVTTAATTDRG